MHRKNPKTALLTLLRETSPPKVRNVAIPASVIASDRIAFLEEELQRKDHAVRVTSSQYETALSLIEQNVEKERREVAQRTEEMKMAYETAIRGLQITHAQEVEDLRRRFEEELNATRTQAHKELQELHGTLVSTVADEQTKATADVATLQAELELKTSTITKMEEKLAQREFVTQQLRAEVSKREQILSRCQEDIEDMQAEIGGIILELKEKALLSDDGGNSTRRSSASSSFVKPYPTSPGSPKTPISSAKLAMSSPFRPSFSSPPADCSLTVEAASKHEKLRALQKQIDEMNHNIRSFRSNVASLPIAHSSEAMQHTLDILSEKCHSLEVQVQTQVEHLTHDLNQSVAKVTQLTSENVLKSQLVRELENELLKAKEHSFKATPEVSSGSAAHSADRIQSLERDLREQILLVGKCEGKIQRLEEKLAKKETNLKTLQEALQVSWSPSNPANLHSPQRHHHSKPLSTQIRTSHLFVIRSLRRILSLRRKRFSKTKFSLFSKLNMARCVLANLQKLCVECDKVLNDFVPTSTNSSELSARITELQNLLQRASSVTLYNLPSITNVLMEEKVQSRLDLNLSLCALAQAREQLASQESELRSLESKLIENRIESTEQGGMNESDLATYQSRIADLSAELARLTHEHTSLTHSSERFKEDLRQRDLAIQILTSQKMEQENKVCELLAKIEEMKSVVHSTSDPHHQLQSLSKESSEKSLQITSLQTNLHFQREQATNALRQVHEKQQQMFLLESEVQRMKLSEHRVDGDLHVAHKRIADLISEAVLKEEQMNKLTVQLKTLEEKYKSLCVELERKSEEIQDLHTRLFAREQELAVALSGTRKFTDQSL